MLLRKVNNSLCQFFRAMDGDIVNGILEPDRLAVSQYLLGQRNVFLLSCDERGLPLVLRFLHGGDHQNRAMNPAIELRGALFPQGAEDFHMVLVGQAGLNRLIGQDFKIRQDHLFDLGTPPLAREALDTFPEFGQRRAAQLGRRQFSLRALPRHRRVGLDVEESSVD